MEHYLDNAATTKPSAAAMEGMAQAAACFGNPSSTHRAGLAAHAFLEDCRAKVALALGIRHLHGDRLVLTASGTEANNLALLGMAYAKKWKETAGSRGVILLSDGEHPSMREPAARLEGDGFTVRTIPTRGGVLDLAALDTILESTPAPVIFAGCMLVNNETGALYDVKAAFARIRARFPGALLHCDAVQGFLKTPFTPAGLGADTLSVSAHKIHGTRGAGALYIRGELCKAKRIVPVLPGGGQEGGLRSGTENLFALGAFAYACEDGRTHFAENREKEASLRALLESEMTKVPGIVIHRPAGAYVPGIFHFSMPGVRSEILLNYLSGEGIYVSAGSACSAHARHDSAALLAFGLDAAERDSAIRVSLSDDNEACDIYALTEALAAAAARLQR